MILSAYVQWYYQAKNTFRHPILCKDELHDASSSWAGDMAVLFFLTISPILKWAVRDLNPRPFDYQSNAPPSWANGPFISDLPALFNRVVDGISVSFLGLFVQIYSIQTKWEKRNLWIRIQEMVMGQEGGMLGRVIKLVGPVTRNWKQPKGNSLLAAYMMCIPKGTFFIYLPPKRSFTDILLLGS